MSNEEKYKIALFMIIRNLKVMPAGMKLGKTEEDTVSFEFKKVENTEIANMTMKGLIMMFESQKSDEDELEVEYGQSRQ